MVVRGHDARDAAFLHEHHRVAIDEAVRFVRAGAVAAQGCVETSATKVKGATVRMPEKPIDRPESPAAELDVARGVAEKLDEHDVSSHKADRPRAAKAARARAWSASRGFVAAIR
jgi:hypothetical protein